MVQPLLPTVDTAPDDNLHLDNVARCAGCAAYINNLCSFEQYGWICSLCALQNDYAYVTNRRYLGGPDARRSLPELASSTVEALSPAQNSNGHNTGSNNGAENDLKSLSVPASPIFIAIVDAACSLDHMELVRSAILAAIEGLPSDAKFGLVTFGGDEIALYEAGAELPCVRHIPVAPLNGPSPTAVELQQVIPLNRLLIPVDYAGKEFITAAVEALEPMGPGKRPLGEALQSVLRLLGGGDIVSGSSTGILGTRIAVILSGAPNYGRGSVVNAPLPSSTFQIEQERTTSSSSSNGRSKAATAASDPIHSAPFLLDPYFPEVTIWSSQAYMENAVSNQPPSPEKQANKPRQLPSTTKPSDGWGKALEGSKELDMSSVALELEIEDASLVTIRWDASTFYKEAGAAAASLGVVVDIYAVSTSFVGLEVLQAVVLGSGGTTSLYTPPIETGCTLPEDLYKRITEPFAFGCMLRLRTSPEINVTSALGNRLRPDPRYPDLFHLACCHPHDAFGLTLDYTTSSGFASNSTPVLQLVFQYLAMVPAIDPTGGQQRTVMQRRTRIVTAAFPVAYTPSEVYASVKSQAYTFDLVQHLFWVAERDGMDAARTALVERLVELVAAFHINNTVGELPKGVGRKQLIEMAGPMDPAFKACDALQGVPRAAYALLRSPLLSGSSPHSDTLCASRVLWDTLSPSELATAVYPHLSSWASPDQLAYPKHSLCRAALALSRQPIYLLDAYHTLIVFYAAQGHVAAGGALPPFPPPHRSQIRQHCAALSQARRLTPRMIVAREGEGGADQLFGQWLIEDDRGNINNTLSNGGGASGGVTNGTFLDFLGHIKTLATELLLRS